MSQMMLTTAEVLYRLAATSADHIGDHFISKAELDAVWMAIWKK